MAHIPNVASSVFDNLKANGVVTGNILPKVGTPAAITTAGNVNLSTEFLTEGFLNFLIRDCNGAPRTDQLPTAAELVAAIPGAETNTALLWFLSNISGGGETWTLNPGVGITFTGSNVFPVGFNGPVFVVFTNVTSGSEAITIIG